MTQLNTLRPVVRNEGCEIFDGAVKISALGQIRIGANSPTRILDICQALRNGNKYVTICLMKITVEEYLRADGSNPYKTWFDRLDAQAAAKVVTAKLRLELGNTSNVKWFAGIGEYIIDWGPGYRIYLAKEGETFIILLGGGTKKGQQKDVDQAQALHAEYKDRKKALTAVKKGKR